MKRHIATGVGLVLGVAAFAFCVQALREEWGRVEESLEDASWGWMVLGLLLAGVGMTWIAARWRACLRDVGGAPPDTGRVVRWYYAGELGKYLPGGVWPILGRGELARRGGVAGTAAYASVALSLAALYGAAVLPIGLVLLHPKVVHTVRRVLSRVVRRPIELEVPDWPTVARLLVSYLPAWMAIAGCSLAISRGLHVGGSWWRIALATVLSWVAGFAAVPVPAGAGIREAVFVATAGIPDGLAAAVAISARICFVIVDGVGGALSSASLGISRRRTVTPETDPAES